MFPPPPVQGLGTIGGFKLQLEDRGSLGYEALDAATKAFMAKACQTPELAGLFSSYQVNVPQLYADIDRTKARQLGVPVTDVFDTMQIYLGSPVRQRLQQVRPHVLGAGAGRRAVPRARRGHRAAQGALDQRRDGAAVGADERASRASGRSARCATTASCRPTSTAAPAPGYSSGQAQDAVERIAAETLPKGIGYEWTELTYQEILAGNSAVLVFPLAILLVFLVLAALYESLTLPLAIILIVPMGLLAAMTGVWLTDGDNNIFTQIGADGAGRAVGEERDPDRRVRARAGVRRAHAGAGRDRGEPAAAAADPDDLARVRDGRAAAGVLHRRRRRDAPGDGHRGVLRDDRRDRCSASS